MKEVTASGRVFETIVDGFQFDEGTHVRLPVRYFVDEQPVTVEVFMAELSRERDTERVTSASGSTLPS